MSKAPFMPLATDAFIGDTTGLNAAETGAYMMLLICQWRNNGLPLDNNPKKLQRMTRCTKAQFNRVWPEIAHFFEVTENTISQKRVEKTMLEVLKKIQVKSESGKLGGRPKSLKTNEPVKANGYDQLKRNESETKATITITKKVEESNTNVLPKVNDLFDDPETKKLNGKKQNDKSKPKRKQQIQTRFPTDQDFPECPEKYQQWAISKGVTKWQPVWTKFFNHHYNKQVGQVSWYRTWQNWISNHIEWGNNRTSNSNGSKQSSADASIEGAMLAINGPGDFKPD